MQIPALRQSSFFKGTARPHAVGQPAFSMRGDESQGTRTHKVYLKTDDMLYSGGNGTGLSFYLKYAEDSNDENPVILAKGVDEKGQEFEQRIPVSEIDPRNATLVEMRAYEAHYGVDKGNGLSSFPPSMANMTLGERGDFLAGLEKAAGSMAAMGRFDLERFYMANLEQYQEILDAAKQAWM